jgi:hypothetical protein
LICTKSDCAVGETLVDTISDPREKLHGFLQLALSVANKKRGDLQSPPLATHLLARAVEIANELQSRDDRATAFTELSLFEAEIGQMVQASAHLDQAWREVSARSNFDSHAAEAFEEAKQIAATPLDEDTKRDLSWVLHSFAEAYYKAGDLKTAQDAKELSVALNVPLKRPDSDNLGKDIRGEAFARRGYRCFRIGREFILCRRRT